MLSGSLRYYGRVELPQSIERPVGRLQTSAAVEQAADTLANYDICIRVWVKTVRPPSSVLLRGPYTDQDMLKLELWRFEVYSAFFYRPTGEAVASCKMIGVLLCHHKRQFLDYLHKHCGSGDLNLVDLVFHRLMRIIGHLRENNLTKDFESAYLEEVVSANSQEHYPLFNHFF